MHPVLRLMALIAAAFGLGVPAQGQDTAETRPDAVPTDSVIGRVGERFGHGFFLHTDAGEELFLEIPSDSVDQRDELEEDSLPRAVPHASVMEPHEIRFVLRQLESSEERERAHVHYVPVEGDPGRRVVVWISVASDRVPGG